MKYETNLPKNNTSAIPIKALTDKQKTEWANTRTIFLMQCPLFAHLFYTLLNKNKNEHIAIFTDLPPTAGVDGVNILINPDFFFKHTMQERVFILSHEILHCVWDHCGQSHTFRRVGKISYTDGKILEYNKELANIAQDLVINDTLIKSNIGAWHKDWLHNPRIGCYTDAWTDVYRRLYDEQDPQGGDGGGVSSDGTISDGPCRGQKRFDETMDPGAGSGDTPEKAMEKRDPDEWKSELSAAVQVAKAQGNLPGIMEQMFGEILNPKVNWRDHIRGIFMRMPGSGGYDFKRPDRRLIVRDIFAPSRSGHGAGTIITVVDNSGSVVEKRDEFLAEIVSIMEDVRPRELKIIFCDAEINGVETVYDLNELVELGRTYQMKDCGGGTDFRPPFKYIHDEGINPDAVIYLTDGLGDFPRTQPDYPVIWASIYKEAYPWGEVVMVKD